MEQMIHLVSLKWMANIALSYIILTTLSLQYNTNSVDRIDFIFLFALQPLPRLSISAMWNTCLALHISFYTLIRNLHSLASLKFDGLLTSHWCTSCREKLYAVLLYITFIIHILWSPHKWNSCDNEAVVQVIQTGKSRNVFLSQLVRNLLPPCTLILNRGIFWDMKLYCWSFITNLYC